MKGFAPAELGQTNQLKDFCFADINWLEPVSWPKRGRPDISSIIDQNGCLYMVLKNHGRSLRADMIRYVGITTSPTTRYNDLHHGSYIASENGATSISYGKINFRGRWSLSRDLSVAIKEIEHIMIWALWNGNYLANSHNILTLPGWGKNGTRAWHIRNTGFDASGRIPKEIVFPWIICR